MSLFSYCYKTKSGSLIRSNFYTLYSYDNDGNFNYLDRYNQSGGYNHLTYTYQSGKNRLSSIYDPTTNSTYTFGYDDNGRQTPSRPGLTDLTRNVISDSHRGIAFIIYDSDNLPVHIYKTNGESQFYNYDMNGNRTRKTITGQSDIFYFNGISGQTEAVCLVPYSSDLTYNILGAGGDNIGQVKVVNNSVTGRYYYLKDHLGSIKVTVNSTGTVVGYDDYYPFGMTMPNRSSVSSADQRYKFTSKERDSETGYDYFGARYYDSWLGRWLQVDPLADNSPGLSPYNYGNNNPIIIIDPTGMAGDSINNVGGGEKGQETTTGSWYLQLANKVSQFFNGINRTLSTLMKTDGGESENNITDEAMTNHGLTNKQLTQYKLNAVNAATSIMVKGELNAARTTFTLAGMGASSFGLKGALLGISAMPFTYANDKYTGMLNQNYSYLSTNVSGGAAAISLAAYKYPIIGNFAGTAAIGFGLMTTDFSYERKTLYNIPTW